MVIDGLIVVIEDKRSATDDDSLGRLRNGQGINLIKTTVKGLSGGVGTHVPHANGTRDVSGDDLLGAADPLNSNQTMVMTWHTEHARSDLRVPETDIMVESSAQNHVHVGVPVEGVNTELMAIGENMLQLESVHIPERNLSIHASRGDVTHRWDREQVHNVTIVNLFFVLANILQISIVGMNFAFETSGEDLVEGSASPFDTKLDHGCVSCLLPLIVSRRVPQFDNVVT